MKNIRPVATFTLAYIGVSTLFALQTGNQEFLYYIAVVLLLSVAALLVHRRAFLSTVVLWGLSLWGLLHMIGGLVPLPAGFPYHGTKAVFYNFWLIPDILKYDHIVHAYGFAIATALCFQALRAALPSVQPTVGILLLCALAGMGLGAVNEIVEFVAVLTIPDTNVGGYENTGWDLVSNAAGAIIAASVLRIRRGKLCVYHTHD